MKTWHILTLFKIQRGLNLNKERERDLVDHCFQGKNEIFWSDIQP